MLGIRHSDSPSYKVAPAPGLEPHNVTTQVLELVTEDPGPDHGLHPHEACPHLGVLPSPIVGSESFLYENGGSSHLEEPPTVVPASNTSLEDQDLPGEDSVPLLLQVEVVGVLQEYFGPAQLVVSFTQNLLADLGSGLPAVHLVGGRAAVDEVPVPLHELLEGVPDRIAGPPDPDGLHHTGVPQLSAAELSVKHLEFA